VVNLFLAGDVMTGRGIDQALAHPSASRIQEPHVTDAQEYLHLAEALSGPIGAPLGDAAIWGDALAELDRMAPDVRIVNLETSVTTSEEFWPGKQIHYRMHPGNVGCLTAARLSVCTLANNHVLDYGAAGLCETLDTLARAGIKTAGAGRNLAEAQAPARVDLPGGGRVSLVAVGSETSGVYASWAATESAPGVDVIADLSETSARALAERIRSTIEDRDLAVVSIHWGSNWGYQVPASHVQFAHALIDGGVDLVYGHSSHHIRPVEVYRNRLILYGCGECLNDYEGIQGYEEFRDDLVLLYVATIDAAGALTRLRMSPMRIQRFRLRTAAQSEARWLRDVLNRISASFGTRVTIDAEARLTLA
jgi:poly-gamma-glutamate synthesis protein (capsule biosynthesis protein)